MGTRRALIQPPKPHSQESLKRAVDLLTTKQTTRRPLILPTCYLSNHPLQARVSYRNGSQKQIQTILLPKPRAWSGPIANVQCMCTLVQQAVFLLYILTTIVLCARYGGQGGMGKIYGGDCERIDHINTLLHLIINVFSTALLGSSNYCMQLLLSPTRQEVDEAHRKDAWLDVGAPSYRNLRAVKGTKRRLWYALGISSPGLHLSGTPLYSKPSRYNRSLWPSSTQNFIENVTIWQGFADGVGAFVYPTQNDSLSRQRLSHHDCIERYIDPLSSGKRLVVVTKDTNSYNLSHHIHERLTYTSLIKAIRSPGPW